MFKMYKGEVMNISGTIAIGNGESCPFCKGKKKFVSNEDNDFLKHMTVRHHKELEKYLFSDNNIGI